MAVNVYMVFVPSQEAVDGKGWKLTHWDDTIEAEVLSPAVVYYTTLTAMQTAVDVLFSDDPSIISYFQGTAETTVLAANVATVNSTRDASLTAEGLTP